MALRIETGAPSRWRRGTTEATCLRVTAAGPGDWIVRYVTGELAVWPDATFRRLWKPVIA